MRITKQALIDISKEQKNSDRGCTENLLNDVLIQARDHPSCKYIRVVSDWLYIELLNPGEDYRSYEIEGLDSVILYATSVLQDQEGRFPFGTPVLTSCVKSYECQGLVETRNTLYVLYGPGLDLKVEYSDLFNGTWRI